MCAVLSDHNREPFRLKHYNNVPGRPRTAFACCPYFAFLHGSYLDWETFQIIYRELVQGLGLCLLAVFVLTLILIAHPTTALLVFLCVTLTIVDVLGIMWGMGC